jgi:uncharacterized protein
MLTQESLDIFRCPLDPSGSRLELVDEALICQRCRLRFPIKDDIPRLVPEEAELPPGCASLDSLPCRQGKSA